jgi:hypothetical protein
MVASMPNHSAIPPDRPVILRSMVERYNFFILENLLSFNRLLIYSVSDNLSLKEKRLLENRPPTVFDAGLKAGMRYVLRRLTGTKRHHSPLVKQNNARADNLYKKIGFHEDDDLRIGDVASGGWLSRSDDRSGCSAYHLLTY